MDYAEIVYEGPGVDEDIFAAAQANFMVRRPAVPSTEVAVFVNHRATALLAEALSREDSVEFRAEMARVVGKAWMEIRYQQFGRFETVLVVSQATIEGNPELVDAARA